LGKNYIPTAIETTIPIKIQSFIEIGQRLAKVVFTQRDQTARYETTVHYLQNQLRAKIVIVTSRV